MTESTHTQPYDHLLKRLVQKQPAVVLPLLFPELAHEVVAELNVELLLPPRQLAGLAERCVTQVTQPEGLDVLLDQTLQASSEEEVRVLFRPYAGS